MSKTVSVSFEVRVKLRDGTTYVKQASSVRFDPHNGLLHLTDANGRPVLVPTGEVEELEVG